MTVLLLVLWTGRRDARYLADVKLLESWHVRLGLTILATIVLVAGAVGQRWFVVACMAIVVITGVANLVSMRAERR